MEGGRAARYGRRGSYVFMEGGVVARQWKSRRARGAVRGSGSYAQQAARAGGVWVAGSRGAEVVGRREQEEVQPA